MYKYQINNLQKQLWDLDQRLSVLETDNSRDSNAIKALLIERYDVQSELRKCTILQWEEDHERVNFEDDR
jgi:hypothetical protein